MKYNRKGLELLKQSEGRRLEAYRDSAGVLTIGYGHTSMAGPPRVVAGMKITAKEAEEILWRDINKFANGVRRYIKRPLNDNQFSALVNFAFNVGLGNFKRSSVLKAVNAGRFDLVPSKLNLWVKAKGLTLRGLVIRRQREGELFMTPVRGKDPVVSLIEPGDVEPVPGKPMLKSTTNWAGVAAGVGGVTAALNQVRDAADAVGGVKESLSSFDPNTLLWLAVAAIITGGVVWIVKERWWKSRHEGS